MTMSNGTTTVAEAQVSAPVLSNVLTAKYLGREVRLGSRKVKIVHYPKSNMLPKDPLAKQIRDEVIKKISPGWRKGTRDINRGLTREEELIYLPSIIGVKADSNDWEAKVKLFWYDFTIVVPTSGLEIEAGFQLKKGLNGEAEPIDILGYISYNVATTHSLVAKEGEDNPAVYDFRVIDLAKQALDEEIMYASTELAERAFHRLAVNSEKTTEAKRTIDYILELKGGPDFKGMNVIGLSDIQKKMELKKFVAKYPTQFRDMVEDKQLETKALLRRAVTFKKILHEGTSYIYNGKMIGNSETAAVAWLDDASNNDDKTIIIVAINEYLK